MSLKGENCPSKNLKKDEGLYVAVKVAMVADGPER